MHISWDFLSSWRKEYRGELLKEKDLPSSPWKLFEKWLQEAIQKKAYPIPYMVLATCSHEGKAPSLRGVLLKEFSQEGLIFVTSYTSRKAKELQKNPYASILFYWEKLDRQVEIQGKVTKLSRKKVQELFQERPREYKISAWASKQSTPLSSREELIKRYQEKEKEFQDKEEIPPPPFWGGYILKPYYFEFLQGQPKRLHDRILYQKKGRNWKITRLFP